MHIFISSMGIVSKRKTCKFFISREMGMEVGGKLGFFEAESNSSLEPQPTEIMSRGGSRNPVLLQLKKLQLIWVNLSEGLMNWGMFGDAGTSF